MWEIWDSESLKCSPEQVTSLHISDSLRRLMLARLLSMAGELSEAKLGTVGHAGGPSIWESEAGVLRV